MQELRRVDAHGGGITDMPVDLGKREFQRLHLQVQAVD